MYIQELNNIKIVFIGDLESINLEIISKSHNIINKKFKYILVGNYNSIEEYFLKIKCKIKLIEIYGIEECLLLKSNAIFIFNIGMNNLNKSKLILNQIIISNNLSKINKNNLITMPINKSVIKKNYKFNGMTEFLELINNSKTFMLMRGNKFSIIPLTTHIEFKNILVNFSKSKLYYLMNKILRNKSISEIKYKNIIFLGINPHAGENGTLGKEESIMNSTITILKRNFKRYTILGPVSADSAFKKIKKNTLFISLYHDQALIPFKILNTKAVNNTIGLDFNRYSPAHGTAEDIIFKNQSDISSYLQCMLN